MRRAHFRHVKAAVPQPSTYPQGLCAGQQLATASECAGQRRESVAARQSPRLGIARGVRLSPKHPIASSARRDADEHSVHRAHATPTVVPLKSLRERCFLVGSRMRARTRRRAQLRQARVGQEESPQRTRIVHLAPQNLGWWPLRKLSSPKRATSRPIHEQHWARPRHPKPPTMRSSPPARKLQAFITNWKRRQKNCRPPTRSSRRAKTRWPAGLPRCTVSIGT